MKINKHIEIVSSTVIPLSSMSRKSREGILSVLKEYYVDVGITIVNNLPDLELLVLKNPDLVFLGMNYIPSSNMQGVDEDQRIWLTDYLDDNHIAYTGSGRAALELGLNKPYAKQRMIDVGVNTSKFHVVKYNQKIKRSEISLSFPIFVKPTNRGCGLGIDSNSVVHNFEQLQEKVNTINKNLKSDSMLEEYLPGREFSVAIIKDENIDKYIAMPVELIVEPDKKGLCILSKQVKCSNSETAIKIIDSQINKQIKELAINVFHALGANDYGRIDIRVDKFGVPKFLEANLMPSLISGYGSFPKACMINAEMDYETMILHIARLGFIKKYIFNKAKPIMLKSNIKSFYDKVNQSETL